MQLLSVMCNAPALLAANIHRRNRHILVKSILGKAFSASTKGMSFLPSLSWNSKDASLLFYHENSPARPDPCALYRLFSKNSLVITKIGGRTANCSLTKPRILNLGPSVPTQSFIPGPRHHRVPGILTVPLYSLLMWIPPLPNSSRTSLFLS